MAAIAAAIFGGSLYLEHRRKQLAAQVAAAAGLIYDADAKRPGPIDFDLFNKGRSRRTRYVMRRPQSDEAVFRYQYTTGSGKNSHTYHFTCALIAVPFRAPHLTIGPEGFWSNLGRFVGIRDIEIESPQFNDRYRVSSEDERFAVTLLDHQMIAWMLSPSSGLGEIRFEFRGNRLLCVNDKLPIEEMPAMLNWSSQILEHLPAVLNDLYPVRR